VQTLVANINCTTTSTVISELMEMKMEMEDSNIQNDLFALVSKQQLLCGRTRPALFWNFMHLRIITIFITIFISSYSSGGFCLDF
jgi:hypothetical protein